MAINGNRFKRMRVQVQQIVRDEMQAADLLIQPYVLEHMHGLEFRTGIRASIKSQRLYGGRNITDELYSQSGDLLRALAKNGKGHIFNVSVTNGSVNVTYGVDVNVIPYARIHEKGGTTGRGGATKLKARPYLNIGVKEFVKEEMQDILNNIVTRIFNIA